MKVQIERFTEPGGILRVWVLPGAKHGDAYQLAMTVRWLDEETIEFLGLLNPIPDPVIGKAIQKEAALRGISIDDAAIEFLMSRSPITKAIWKAIQDEAARMGITRIKASRWNTGVERVRWIRTSRRAG
ncbi:MAG: hypothetical protein ACTHK7_01870 [Aureliella sp.]